MVTDTTAGKLSLVATPIGNLGDISQRGLATLESADTVLAEDTRVAGKLLSRFDIRTHLERCDENVIAKRAPALVERLKAGEVMAFVSDAGTPCVSDPGAILVAACREAGVTVDVIPGPSAVITALVASGLPMDTFFFAGFLPRKKSGRIHKLNELAAIPGALVFYESPNRVAASLADIAEVFPDRQVAMARELTKLHEEVLVLPAAELAQNIAARQGVKGEIVLIVSAPIAGNGKVDISQEDLEAEISRMFDEGMNVSKIAKAITASYEVSRGDAYDCAVKLSKSRDSVE